MPAAIYDDNPPSTFVFPVFHSKKMPTAHFDAIVIGSDTWQSQIIQRITKILDKRKLPPIFALDTINISDPKAKDLLANFFDKWSTIACEK